MGKSNIQWTDYVWNPIAGCTKCSPGCKNCYAETMAKRLKAMRVHPYWPPFKEPQVVDENGWTGNIHLCHAKVGGQVDTLCEPLHLRKPRKIFVCSMSDLFHEKVPFEFISRVFWTIQRAKWHTYQILTKRPERILPFMKEHDHITENAVLGRRYLIKTPFNNVHIGVSVSTQAEADEKIPILLQIPAAVRFVSVEPMLEGIKGLHIGKCGYYCDERVGHVDHTYLDWVIVGCESGVNRRPCKIEWIDSIVDQCKAANVPCFVKQINVNGKVVKMPKQYPQQIERDRSCTEQ